jgi:hypothetical protein
MRHRPSWLIVHRGGVEDAGPLPTDATDEDTLTALREGCARASRVVGDALQLIETMHHPESAAARHELAAEFSAILTALAQPPARLLADPDTLRHIESRLDAALAALQAIARVVVERQ